MSENRREAVCGGNTLQMGQLVKPKLILGPLHREVNTALFKVMLNYNAIWCKTYPNELIQ